MNVEEAIQRLRRTELPFHQSKVEFHTEQLQFHEAKLRETTAAINAMWSLIEEERKPLPGNGEQKEVRPTAAEVFPDDLGTGIGAGTSLAADLAAALAPIHGSAPATAPAGGSGVNGFDRVAARAAARRYDMHYPLAKSNRHWPTFYNQALIAACTHHPKYDEAMQQGVDLRHPMKRNAADLAKAIDMLGVDRRLVEREAYVVWENIYFHGTKGLDFIRGPNDAD